MSKFDTNFFSYFEAFKNQLKLAPLNLGGVPGSGGGAGGPPGGFFGFLPQTRISYDYSELATNATPSSGISLLDNLNHIRYRLNSLETGGVGSGIAGIDIQENNITIASTITVLNFEGGATVVNNGGGKATVTISGGTSTGISVKQSGSSIATGVTTLNFVGSTVTDDTGGQVTISGSSGSATGHYGTVLMDSTLGSAQATFDYDPGGTINYDYIKIFVEGNSDGVGSVDTMKIAFNNDTTTANYRYAQHTGGTAHTSTVGDNNFIAWIGSSANSSCTGQVEITINNPSNTSFHKTAVSTMIGRDSTTAIYTGEFGVAWENTAAINRITLSFFSVNFATGTRCLIIGYKNH